SAANYISFGGSNGKNFNMLVDNVDNYEDTDGGTVLVYSLEGVQEFRALTSNFDAQYGRAAATIVLATKSGTNSPHGSAFGYARNQSMIVTDYFSQPAHGGQGKQSFSRGQYGGSMGGPLMKDRAWYFGSIERVQQNFVLPRPDRLYQELVYVAAI